MTKARHDNVCSPQGAEQVINRLLALDPELPEKLAALSGKTLQIVLTDLRQTLFLHVDRGQLQIRRQCATPPDCIIRGSVPALTRMMTGGDVATSLLQGRVAIEGDMRVGKAFRNAFRGSRFDWQSALAGIVGDSATQQLENTVRAVAGWGKNAWRSVNLNLAEYLQEESRALPAVAEVEQFYREVDTFRDGVARLEQRLKRLAPDDGGDGQP